MEFVGYSTSAVTPMVLGEVRGVYGGLFAAMGAFTLAAVANPGANRSALLLIALLWFGVCGGRLAGSYLDGDPGLPGWIAAGFEFAFGVIVAVAAIAARPRPENARRPERNKREPTFPLAGPTEL